MLNAIDVLKQARELGSTKTMADVQVAIAAVDRVQKEAKHKTRYRVELWDKVSPINGVSPEVVKERHDITDGEVYLIYIDGNLVFLQAHDPAQIGFAKMDKVTAKSKADKHVADLVESHVDAEALNEVLLRLL